MPTQKKIDLVSQVKEKITTCDSAVLVDFHGMSVADQESLRTALRASHVEVKVIKNTLLKIAFNESGYAETPDTVFSGQTAIAFGFGDVVSAPKAVKKAETDFDKLHIKYGFTQAAGFITSDDVKRLADIPSREVLYGQVVGTIAAPLSGLVSVLQANIRPLVTVLDAYRAKQAA
ncbi:MAG TPA: 50S ribosomal protein L10 [bacterium]|nr:50S ribosomal protein L10 [bacterium]